MRGRRIPALILASLLIGCGDGSSIPVTHLMSLQFTSNAFPAEAMLVVRDEQTWQNLWSQMDSGHTPPQPLPQVDFANDALLVAAAGPRPTGGSVTITGAKESSSGVTVEVTVATPGSGCAVAAVVTSPVDLAIIARRDATISFRVTRKVVNC